MPRLPSLFGSVSGLGAVPGLGGQGHVRRDQLDGRAHEGRDREPEGAGAGAAQAEEERGRQDEAGRQGQEEEGGR
eukprot:9470836-Pyramimonas_sp.AAC.1